MTVLLVEQNARRALEVADHAYVLELGRVVLSGPAQDLAADPRVQQAYLGGTPSETSLEAGVGITSLMRCARSITNRINC